MISPPRDQIEIGDMPHWQRSSLVTRFVHRLNYSLGTTFLNTNLVYIQEICDPHLATKINIGPLLDQ